MEMYFAYGSNMLKEQMRVRCPSSRFVATGMVLGYSLCFPRVHDRWNGGVAGLREDSTSKVEGVLYELSRSDLTILDGYEGIAAKHYSRERVKVILKDESQVEAWVYFANVQGGGCFSPSDSYINVMIRGAKESGLSAEGIAQLQQIRDSLPKREK